MTHPENPADRDAHTRTDGAERQPKDAQLKGNRRPDRDLPRGAEGDTRRASGMPR
jgi:hypothetical protein